MRRFIVPAAAAFVLSLAAGVPQPAEAGLFDIFHRNDQQQAAPLPPGDIQSAPPAGSDAVPVQSSSSDAQAALRMDRMEQQMRVLTGQVEELTFQVHQLQEQLRGQSGGAAKRAAAPPPAAAPKQADAAPAPPAAADPVAAAIGSNSDALAASGPGAPPRPLGQLNADPTAPKPLDLSALSNTGAAIEPPPPTGSARGDYDAAYDLVLKGDYDVAETTLRRFLASYPTDPLAADAQYWLGESLYARQDYRGAADAFLAGYQQFPKSSKAPDMLLKLALSLNGLGQRDAACTTYGEILKKYPKSSNALIQRVKAEQASASC